MLSTEPIKPVAAMVAKPAPCNDAIVQAMPLATFSTFCTAMASTASIELLEALYSQCVERKKEVDALICQSKKQKKSAKGKKAAQPTPDAPDATDYAPQATQIQQIMTVLSAAASEKGHTLVRGKKPGPNQFTVNGCLLLLKNAAALLSDCEPDDTEAQDWLTEWEAFQHKKGFPSIRDTRESA